MTKARLEVIGRREFVLLSGAAGLAAALGATAGPALASAVDDAIAKATGGAKAGQSDKIKIKLPEIAENGNTVPITVNVDSPMTDKDYVNTVHVFADGNPQPTVASYHFTPMSGKAMASSRIRLAKTQNIIAVADLGNGKFVINKAQVKVTIGGCGG